MVIRVSPSATASQGERSIKVQFIVPVSNPPDFLIGFEFPFLQKA
jgi:hypothetical protein